jgi:hypothetical protein
VTYLKYTFATLGFAKNASVVKLAPKKATVAASAAERKLMAELEAMKALVEQLKSQNAAGGGGGGGGMSEKGAGGMDADAARMIAELQEKLAAKQGALATEMGGDGDDERAQQQRAEYARRGIALVAFEGESNTHPYFMNLDEDAFRSNRFMYIIDKVDTPLATYLPRP